MDVASLEPNRTQLVQEVKNRSQRPDLVSEELEYGMARLEALNSDPWELCAGPDLVSVLSLGLHRKFGTNSATAVNAESLKMLLRLSFSNVDLAEAQISKDARGWEARNPPFIVLR